MQIDLFLGVFSFTGIVLLLVAIIIMARSQLVSSGEVSIEINGDSANAIKVPSGSKLLQTLAENKIFLSSACGGGVTCSQCKCQIAEGGGSILPTEESHFNSKEKKEGWRLSCQVAVKNDLKITIPEEVFGVKEWEATVVSNYNVATYIKEFIVELPQDMDYIAGGYIQIKIPECEVKYSEMDVTAHPQDHPGEPEKFEKVWAEGNFALRNLVMKNDEEIVRAYSMASYPAEGKKVMLNVRVAAPPWDREKNAWADINPGIASSYIFGLKAGEKVTISGPYGEFFINDTDAEMLYIGGGAGMAPMRSHLYELFKTLQTGRKVTFWYGGRSKAELFYIHYFRDLEKDFPNFKFHLVLSDALPEDNWKEKKCKIVPYYHNIYS